ncbi:MAG: preprotein translocase subunit SecG [Tannerella sp.]|jgi:preprotein translocase subunit SecG|nr:preprotein translocase subunit SecG [Tannerella sp.]
MYTFLSILIVLVAIALVLIVLVQNSKGGGLAAGFSSSNQVLGVRKTTDFLEKFTWGAAIVLVVLCISITAWIPREKGAAPSEVLPNVSLPIQQTVPDFGTTPLPDATQQPSTEIPQSAQQPTEETPGN